MERDVAIYPGFAAGGMYWQLKMSYIKIEKDSKDFLQINKETCII